MSTISTFGWGSSNLAVGDNLSHSSPVGLVDNIEMAAGQAEMLLSTSGHVYVCGNNATGLFGDGTPANSLTNTNNHARLVPSLSNITKILDAQSSYYALDASGNLWAWGSDQRGQFARAPIGNQLTPIIIKTNVTDFDSGIGTTIVLLGGGTVQTVGYGLFGQLANGGTTQQNSWQTVTPSGAPVIQVQIGGGGNFPYSMCLRSDGTIVGSGIDQGVWASVTATQYNSFVPAAMSNAIKICNGWNFEYWHTLRADGTIWGMGNNSWGQVGNTSHAPTHSNSSVADITTPVLWTDPSGLGVSPAGFPRHSSEQFIVVGNSGLVYSVGESYPDFVASGTSTPYSIFPTFTGNLWVSDVTLSTVVYFGSLALSPFSSPQPNYVAMIG